MYQCTSSSFLNYVVEPAVVRNLADVFEAVLLDCSAAFDDTSDIVLAAHPSTKKDLHVSDRVFGAGDETPIELKS